MKSADIQRANFRVQQWVVGIGIFLLVIKFIAYILTGSLMVLSDALESIVNVLAGLMSLFSLYYTRYPKDRNHPYGHGKIEFVSAGIEGAMVVAAGIMIIIEGTERLFLGHRLERLEIGITLVGLAGLVNWILGYWSVKVGRKQNSLPLIASGKHLQSDAYSSLGLIGGILLVKFLDWVLIDTLLAIALGVMLLVPGFQIVRKAIAGIMDEQDEETLKDLLNFLNVHRQAYWVDIHHLRVIRYGAVLHIDAHIIFPYYWTVQQGYEAVRNLSQALKKHYGEATECSFHIDPCEAKDCTSCQVFDCHFRKQPFLQKLEWNIQHITSDDKSI